MEVKPILFNTDMVRAILDGRKTVTRRLPSKRVENNWIDYEEWVTAVAPPGSTSLMEKEFYEQYPPYHSGDILYVRETFKRNMDGYSGIDFGGYIYKADCRSNFKDNYNPWHQSIHMPKEAARIFLKVTDVRVERLQEITTEQARAEGCDGRCECPSSGAEGSLSCVTRDFSIEKFETVWDSTIKKSDLDRYGWDANPWVWVIEFERCEKPES